MNSKDTRKPIRLKLDTIGWSVGKTEILKNISLEVEPGEMLGIIGPNGSGKSSLLRCVYRYLQPTKGVIYIGKSNLEKLSLQQSATQIAAVLQERRPDFHINVFEAVLMGRTPHKKQFARDSSEDHTLAAQALCDVDLEGYAGRSLNTLSGGELQRVYLARALCQQARLLILDEPTNHLDIAHQLNIMARIKEFSFSSVAALHDLNIAAMFCDKICVLCKGEIVAQGVPEAVLNEMLIRDVYGVMAHIETIPETGKLNISYRVTKNQ